MHLSTYKDKRAVDGEAAYGHGLGTDEEGSTGERSASTTPVNDGSHFDGVQGQEGTKGDVVKSCKV
jgi:hypothetical protein